MTTGQLKIHSENILPIIKRWLYSEKDIFIRELISNACDALHKCKILRDQGELEVSNEAFRIDVKIDKEAKRLTFSDTGIGMTADEVERYIAQIAFSGAEDFVAKFQEKGEKEQIIGHFGLGFFSSYMAADSVEIDTLSYQKDVVPAHWSCDGSSDYQLGEGKRKERGTEITLHISEESEDFLEEHYLKGLLTRYCKFLPYPIYLNDQRINPEEPLWVKAPSECTRDDYLAFYRTLYPMEAEPLFWVHLNVDYPFNLKGVLYFPKMKRDLDQKKHNISLYCNRVFVSDDCKDLLPEFLLSLKGAIDSPDIPLNVSRSSLQSDRTVRQVASHIAKKVADSLVNLFKSDRERFVSCWGDIEIVAKLGSFEDSKFCDRVKDTLIWKSTEGEWTTIPEYLEKNKTENKIFYTNGEKGSCQFLKMYTDRGIDVLQANPMIDTMFLGFLEEKIENGKFQRIDAEISDSLIDKERENSVLDADGRTQSAKLADLVRKKLDVAELEVEAKSLVNNDVPSFVAIEEQTRRQRDAMRQMIRDDQVTSGLIGKHTFVVNTNNAVIKGLPELEQRNPELAKQVVEELYQISLLSQRELPPQELDQFLARTSKILEALV